MDLNVQKCKIKMLLTALHSGSALMLFVTSELWDGAEARLLRNVTRKRPRFELDNLQSGKRLIIKIYSANKKGKQREQGRLRSGFEVIKLPSLTGNLKHEGRDLIMFILKGQPYKRL